MIQVINNLLIFLPKVFAVPVENPNGPGATEVNDIGAYLNLYLPAITGILGGVAFLVMIIAGYIYMTSQGDQAKVGLAKELIIGVITGILLLFLINVLRNEIGF